MSFIKGLFKGNPQKAAAKHERRAKEYQREGDEKRAGFEWAAAGRNYAKIPNLKLAKECYVQAAQFFLATDDAKHEEEMLRFACDLAIDAGEYEAAADILDLLTRIGTRKKDNQLLLNILALKTLAFLSANDLAKAKETSREAQKVRKRIGRSKSRFPLLQISQALIARFVDGEPILGDTKLPERTNESESINRLIERLLTLFQNTKDVTLNLSLGKEEAKIKEPIDGTCYFNSPIILQVMKNDFFLPSNFSQVTSLNFKRVKDTRYSAPFTIEAYLAGEFKIGPIIVVFQVDNQRFQLKSNSVPLRIVAAKPHIQIIAESPSNIHTQEEFELSLRVDNSSHGDASDINIRITLDPSLLLQTGTLEKRIITLQAQQQVQFPLYLIATKAGTFEGSVECSYQGLGGEPSKATHSFKITVKPQPRKPKD